MNIPEIRHTTSLGKPQAAVAGAPAPEIRDPQDSSQVSGATAVAPVPAKVAPETLHVSMRIPASLVPGLAGRVVALVSESEVKDGKWQGTRPLLVPRLLNADLSTEQPGEGRERVMGEVAIQADSGPVHYLVAGEVKPIGQDLGSAVAALGTPDKDAILNLSLGLSPDEMGKVDGATIAFLDGPVARTGEAPPVTRAMQSPKSEFLHVAMPMSMRTDLLDSSPEQAIAEAQLHGNIEQNMATSYDVQPWARDVLEGYQIDREAARGSIERVFTAMDATGRIDPALFETEQGRKDVATTYLLQHARSLAWGKQQFGHDVMESLKVAVHRNSWEPLHDDEGRPKMPIPAAQQLWVPMNTFHGRNNPFKDLGYLGANGADTRFEALESLHRYMNPGGAAADSEVGLFLGACERQRQLRGVNPEAVSSHDTLGALKETSDKMLQGLELLSKVKGGLAVGSAVVGGLASLAFWPAGVAGGALAAKFFVDRREARQMLENEKRINAVLTGMIEKASGETEAPLVQWMAASTASPSPPPPSEPAR